jgi:hypothetical protein
MRRLITGAVFTLSALLILGAPASAYSIYNEPYAGADEQVLTAYDAGYSLRSGSGTAKIDAPGLSVPGQGSGGYSLYLSNTAFNGAYSYRHAVPGQQVSTFYVSALFKVPTLEWSRNSISVDIPLVSSTGTESLSSFGIDNGPAMQLFATIGGSRFTLGYSYTANTTAQIVAKYVYNSTNHRVSMYAAVNPPAGATEPLWTPIGATLPNDTAPYTWSLNEFGVTAYMEVRNASGWVDEIRIASTYAEVVPIPGALWLLGSGLVGLAVLRRKRTG